MLEDVTRIGIGSGGAPGGAGAKKSPMTKLTDPVSEELNVHRQLQFSTFYEHELTF
jgi:hypothetical protein